MSMATIINISNNSTSTNMFYKNMHVLVSTAVINMAWNRERDVQVI